MGLDYYAILNIPRNASDVEIRLAYRRLAVRCHPKNDFYEPPEIPFPSMPLEQYWELLNEAFEVLSNPLRKQIYDVSGEEGLKLGFVTPNGFVDPYVFLKDCMGIYRRFFATYSPYGDLIDAVTSPPPLCQDDNRIVRVKGPDIEHFVDLELEEVFQGAVKKMQITREECINEAQVQTILVQDTLTVYTQPGVPTGTKIRFTEAGDCSPKIIPSDIVFVVREKAHPEFQRNGADLNTTVSISLQEAMLGFPLEIDGIDGRRLVIQIVDVVHPQYVKVLKGEGLPFPNSEEVKKRGDLHVSFKIHFPDFIPEELRDKFRLLFEKLDSANC